MFSTEEEAAKQWCPHVRLPAQFTAKMGGQTVALAAAAVNVSPSMSNDMTRQADSVNCIGSKCSQWRRRFGDAAIAGEAIVDSTRVGYCGLAGAPQT